MTVRTQLVHCKPDQELINIIEQKLQALERHVGRIAEATVTLRLEAQGAVEQRITEIRINIPGSIVFVREHSRSFEVALEKAILALRRQLIRYKKKLARQ